MITGLACRPTSWPQSDSGEGVPHLQRQDLQGLTVVAEGNQHLQVSQQCVTLFGGLLQLHWLCKLRGIDSVNNVCSAKPTFDTSLPLTVQRPGMALLIS